MQHINSARAQQDATPANYANYMKRFSVNDEFQETRRETVAAEFEGNEDN